MKRLLPLYRRVLMLLPRLQNIPPPPRLAALVLIAAVGVRLLLREEEGPRWVRGLTSPDMVHAPMLDAGDYRA